MGESQLLLTSCGSVSKHLETQHSTSLEDYKDFSYNGHSFFLITEREKQGKLGKTKTLFIYNQSLGCESISLN